MHDFFPMPNIFHELYEALWTKLNVSFYSIFQDILRYSCICGPQCFGCLRGLWSLLETRFFWGCSGHQDCSLPRLVFELHPFPDLTALDVKSIMNSQFLTYPITDPRKMGALCTLPWLGVAPLHLQLSSPRRTIRHLVPLSGAQSTGMQCPKPLQDSWLHHLTVTCSSVQQISWTWCKFLYQWNNVLSDRETNRREMMEILQLKRNALKAECARWSLCSPSNKVGPAVREIQCGMRCQRGLAQLLGIRKLVTALLSRIPLLCSTLLKVQMHQL